MSPLIDLARPRTAGEQFAASPTAIPRLGAAHISVLNHVADGCDDSEIAELMGLSEQAVRDILNEVCTGYGIPTRTELAEIVRTKLPFET